MSDRTSTAAARPGWVQAVPVAEGGIVAAITVIAAVVSFYHEYQLAHLNGQPRWAAVLFPAFIDGLIALAAVTLLWATANKVARPWRPWVVLAVGIAATVGANLAADLRVWWFRPAVSTWPGVAVAIAGEMFIWLVRARRNLVTGESPQPASACSCPPPPVSLAEALPLARERLRARGDTCGEDRLADLFGTTRHKVRIALSPPVGPVAVSLNGHGAGEDVTS